MNWNDTVASHCRYGDVIGKLFEKGNVIWEHSEDGYQGFANVLIEMPDKTYIHYEWTYGSCSGCDEWESRRLSNNQILAEVRKHMNVIPDLETLRKYVHLDKKTVKGLKYPTANDPTNGSIPGILRLLSGGGSDDLKEMANAVDKLKRTTRAKNKT